MSILKSWDEWSARALPADAPVNQRVSMKTAFMCGAAIALREVIEAQDQPTRIQLLGAEIQQFIALFNADGSVPN